MFSDISQHAFEYAKAAHASINQKRKYSGEEYIAHPMRVVKILKDAGENDPEILAAAYLHDVLEDVYQVNNVYRPEMIEELFGTRVLNLVKELTNIYTSSAFPTINRFNRKSLEVERLSKISLDALKVKFADIIDNTSDIITNDPNFAAIYLKEKKKILDSLHTRSGEIENNQVASKLFNTVIDRVKGVS